MPGETVGKFGLLTNAPRSTTVYAIRETNLVELSPRGFETLLRRYPSVLRDIVKIIAERQQRSVGFGHHSQVAALAIAIVPTSPHLDLENFAAALVRACPSQVTSSSSTANALMPCTAIRERLNRPSTTRCIHPL